MARCKKQFKEGIQNSCVKPQGIVNDGLIVVHQYNATLFAECMAASVNDCIQVLFSSECKMILTHLNRTWLQDFTQIESVTTLPMINNAMTFLAKNNFITGGKYSTRIYVHMG